MTLLNRKIAPTIVDAVHYQMDLKNCEHHQLTNGVPVYMIDAGAEEVLQVEWVYWAGNCYEEQKFGSSYYKLFITKWDFNKIGFSN